MDVILFFEEVFLFPIKNAIEILNMDKRYIYLKEAYAVIVCIATLLSCFTRLCNSKNYIFFSTKTNK